ncbi:MAG: glycosyltransferase [Planctomycetales bacterium]|nr:glycosyltransferase [Planctomycetales bacterium]
MISGVILARNEEGNILDCITQLRPFVTEIVLIDMESTDRTVEIARPHVAKLLSHALQDNFDAARNICLPHVQNDWIWFVDADERIPATTGEAVQRLLQEEGDSFEALYVPFKSYFCGQWIQHCGWWPGFTMPRVLKRGHFSFREALHSGVEVRGRTRFMPADPDLAVDHFSYQDIHHYVEKFNRYTSTEATNLASAGTTYDWEQATRAMTRDLWSYYERGEGNKEGSLGWVLSWLAGQYRWFSHAKLLDGPCESHISVPTSVDHFLSVMQSELSRCRAGQRDHTPQVVLRTPLWDYSGYADDGRQVAKALSLSTADVRCEPLPWNQHRAELPRRETALLSALTRAERKSAPICITNCIPGIHGPDPDAAFNVLRCTFETDRIPFEWVPKLADFDDIWVLSEQNAEAFRRGGAAPERLRVVPSAIDTQVFSPTGTVATLPAALQGRFVFLTTFDWQQRKGWDLLLRAYVESFSVDDGAGLLLKVTRLHHQPQQLIESQVEQLLASFDSTLGARPDIQFCFDDQSQAQMADLYRAADAFVLPTRGEGWGRPLMEAMACGLPTIATRGSGQLAFMTDENSLLVDAELVEVSTQAAAELPVYAGHRWWEPDGAALAAAMQRIATDSELQDRLGQNASASIAEQFSLEQLSAQLTGAIDDIVARHFRSVSTPSARPGSTCVRIEGEIFSGHSFSNINEVLAVGLDGMSEIDVAVQARSTPNESIPPQTGSVLRGLAARRLAPQVVIRHAFPPDWSEPVTQSNAPELNGSATRPKWIHIQPWEFGHLPKDWVTPLRERVDEIWAPSEYVKQVFLQSGIPEDRIHVIPWGVNPDVYRPDAPPLQIPGRSEFAFLFVGGTIARKGFDLAFQAFLEEFADDPHVCLVVKDLGTRSFYRFGNYREAILRHIQSGNLPRVIYLDHDMTDGQRASLYAAADCLLMPYRGEGFGLPILEAMACGTPAIVPQGGPSDDFVDDDSGFRIPATIVETEHDWRLCGPALELAPDIGALKRAMRDAVNDRECLRAKGSAAAKRVHAEFTWPRVLETMRQRIQVVSQQPIPARPAPQPVQVTTCLWPDGGSLSELPDTLASARVIGSEILAAQDDDQVGQLARESGARLFRLSSQPTAQARTNRLLARATKDWIVLLRPGEVLQTQQAMALSRTLAQLPAEIQAVEVGVRDGRTGASLAQEIRIVRNVSGLQLDADSPHGWSQLTRGIAFSPLEILVRDHARPDFAELHATVSNGHRSFHALHRLGRAHLLAGNPFHAECYLDEATRMPAASGSGSDVELLHRQLCAAHLCTDGALAAHRVAEDFRNRHGKALSPPVGFSVPCDDDGLRLYLGAGNKRLPGYFAVDVVAGDTVDLVHDLNVLPWPWEDSSISHIVAEDLVEHLEINLIQFCNEAWRVLRPGGELFVRTPHHHGDSSWIDPTHRWHLHQQSFEYLDPDRHWGQVHPHYAERKWRILSLGVRGPQNIHVTMTPRK